MTSRTTGYGDLYAAMLERGISRRAFIQFSAAMAAALALPASYAPRIAKAVAEAPRVPVIWLRGQDCGGNTGAFLLSADPPVTQLMLDLLSIDYHESLMAPAGQAALKSRMDTMAAYPDGYIAIVEGAVPTAEDGVHCTIGGRSFRDVAREVCGGALATIAVGACACDGGAPSAGGGPTGAVGVGDVVSTARLIALPGCPVNSENLTATIVHYLTFGEWPPTDAMNRPYFAYGALIHNQCERRPHFEYGEFVVTWGDEGAQKGWCLYKVGCKGPETFANCPTVKYSSGTSWPVRAGTGCFGCHMPGFWDAMSPFYRRIPPPLPFMPTVTADQIGQLMIAGVLAGTAVHGTASYVRDRRVRASEQREALAAAAAEDGPVAEAVEPFEAVAPAEAVGPVEPVENGQPVEPAEAVEHGQAVEPVEPAEALEPPVDAASGPSDDAAAADAADQEAD